MEQLEDDVLNRPTPELLQELTRTKNRLTQLRRCIWPQREVANSLVRDENPLINNNVWFTMITIGIGGMLAFFWRKGWIGPKR